MKVVKLYRTVREDGGVTVSPTKVESGEYTETYRLIAADGKLLTLNGIDTTPCVDVDFTDGWYEVDAPVDEAGGEADV